MEKIDLFRILRREGLFTTMPRSRSLKGQEKRCTVPFELISLHNVTTIERLVNGRVLLPMRKQQSIRISNDVILLITHRVGTSNFLKTKKMRIKRTSFLLFPVEKMSNGEKLTGEAL